MPDDRILVVIQLSGGNDGLNTVVPYGMGEYYNARPRIAIKQDEALRTSVNGIGLHPEMGGIKAMLDAGQATILQGVGYPNPNRSHFSSMDIWHTADPSGAAGRGLGWIGRAMDERRETHHGDIEPTACVCIGHDAPLAANGQTYKPIAFERANLFRWVGRDLHPALAKEYDTINRAGVLNGVAPADHGGQAAFVMRTAARCPTGQRQDPAGGPGLQPDHVLPPSGQLANQLRMVAAMIRALTCPPASITSISPAVDTHAGQPYAQARQLKEFAAATKAFFDELKAIGHSQPRAGHGLQVSSDAASNKNASNGTDHGTAAPHVLIR